MKAISQLPKGYERRIPIDLSQPCWLWSNHIEEHGYARIMIDGAMKYVHRLSYQLHVGPIPRGWQIDHVCHTDAVKNNTCKDDAVCQHRSCWNPAHLEAVSSYENSMRGNHPLFQVARQKTCSRGHDLTIAENVYTRPNGRRRCRVCQIESQRERRRNARANT